MNETWYCERHGQAVKRDKAGNVPRRCYGAPDTSTYCPLQTYLPGGGIGAAGGVRATSGRRLIELFALHGHRLTYVTVRQARDVNGNKRRSFVVLAGPSIDVTREVAHVCATDELPSRLIGAGAYGNQDALRAGQTGPEYFSTKVGVALFFDGERIRTEVI